MNLLPHWYSRHERAIHSSKTFSSLTGTVFTILVISSSFLLLSQQSLCSSFCCCLSFHPILSFPLDHQFLEYESRLDATRSMYFRYDLFFFDIAKLRNESN